MRFVIGRLGLPSHYEADTIVCCTSPRHRAPTADQRGLRMSLLNALGLRPTRARAAGAGARAPAGVTDAGDSGPVDEGKKGAKGSSGGSGAKGTDAKPTPQAPKVVVPTGGTSPGDTPAKTTPVTAPQDQSGAPDPAADYEKERAAVQALIDALASHAQAKRIDKALKSIRSKMKSAAGHAAKSAWPAAMGDLGDARNRCGPAKQLADDWAAFAKKVASTRAQASAVTGFDNNLRQTTETAIAAAETQAETDLPGAVVALDGVFAGMKPYFVDRVQDVKDQLDKVEAMGAAITTYLAKDISDGKALVAQAQASIGSEDWSQVLMSWRAAWKVIGPLERYGERRAAFETQRTLTLAGIADVKALDAVKNHGGALDALLAQADSQANRSNLKIEEGTKTLAEGARRCAALKAIAPTVTAHDTDRPLADAEFDALGKHAAAGQVGEAIAAIRKQLAEAATAATQARSNSIDPTVPWNTAARLVKQARVDLAAAKKLADGLGPAAAAAKAATAGGNATQLKQAVAALKADLKKAEGAPHADLAKKPLERCAKAIEAAEKALGKNDTSDGAARLGDAAAALAEARTLQGQHAQFETLLAGVEARLKTIQALPRAAQIQPKIKAVVDAIAAAKKQDRREDGLDAVAVLRDAEAAAAAAEQADLDRKKFDDDAKKITDRIAAELTDQKDVKAVTKLVDDARKVADQCRFADADKALKKAAVEIGSIRLKAGMKKKPPPSNLKDIARQMTEDGGAGVVDKAIQDSPGDSPAVILALASGRYGKPFTFEDSSPGKQHVKSLKRICEVFSKIPEDLADNPSIKTISHADAQNSAGGGYTSASAHVNMKGRMTIKQEFGNKEEHYDPKTGADVKALPKDLDPDCQPKDGKKMDFLGFAAAHEVGHGVDDKRGFMATNGSGPKYGGWEEYGSSVQPIADAVGPHIKGKFPASKFYDTPETKKYVLDKLMSKPATRPKATAGSDDFKALDAFDEWFALATASDVYRRQGDCDAITIGGRIYHEAYARRWVSYLAAARSKGLTGYQFRAPGEWFAELYAGWKSGKLGDKHPALEWLKKL
jgi:hypothetical protein